MGDRRGEGNRLGSLGLAFAALGEARRLCLPLAWLQSPWGRDTKAESWMIWGGGSGRGVFPRAAHRFVTLMVPSP
jgi:hypothetical protein